METERNAGLMRCSQRLYCDCAIRSTPQTRSIAESPWTLTRWAQIRVNTFSTSRPRRRCSRTRAHFEGGGIYSTEYTWRLYVTVLSVHNLKDQRGRRQAILVDPMTVGLLEHHRQVMIALTGKMLTRDDGSNILSQEMRPAAADLGVQEDRGRFSAMQQGWDLTFDLDLETPVVDSRALETWGQ